MRHQGIAYILRGISPLDAGVHPLRSLPEDRGVDLRLIEPAIRTFADVVKRVADESDAGTLADIEIELLPHGDDRRVVNIAPALEFRLEFRLRGLVGFRGDRPKQPELMLGEQFNGAIRQSITLRAPAIPADVGVNVLR